MTLSVVARLKCLSIFWILAIIENNKTQQGEIMAAVNCTKEIAEFYQLTQSKLARIWERDGKRCHWCDVGTILTRHTIPNQATMDHVLPASKGGSNEEANLVLACLRCNGKRGASVLSPDKSERRWRTNFATPSASELINEPLEKELLLAREAYRTLKERVEYLESRTPWEVMRRWCIKWLITKLRRNHG